MAVARRFKQAVKQATKLIRTAGAAVLAAVALAGCGEAGVKVPAAPRKTEVDKAGYVTPPRPTGLTRAVDGTFVLAGEAAPGARVRLATPQGEAQFAQADDAGAWLVKLPPSAEARLFGLSMTVGGRQVQAQGYVLVGAHGEVAVLRAGAGAYVLPEGGGMRVTALDFDAEGGAVVSGIAAERVAVTVRSDGRQVADGRTGASGRFAVAFSAPIGAGRHRLTVTSGANEAAADFDVTPARPLAGAPFRADDDGDALRVDWLTPGGGLQSTLIRH